MNVHPESEIFDRLLDLNGWARPFWTERLALIEAGTWNVSSLNYPGNRAAGAWLAEFQAARTRATLDRLRSGGHAEWNSGVYDVVAPLFVDPEFAAARPGSPMIPGAGGGASTNFGDRVEGYSVGQFKADVLMLGQAGLDDVDLSDTLDLSALTFTVGPWVYTSRLRLVAHETRFGPFGDFVSCRFDLFDGAGAEFFGDIGFTAGRFSGDAIFAGAAFAGGASIQGVAFDAASDFPDATFESWCAFAGTVFGELADFRNATFQDDTTFEHAVFNASADFSGASFRKGAATAGVDPEIARMIAAARR